MLRHLKYTKRNWLKRKRRLIQKSVNIFLIMSIIDFTLIIIKPIRNYHFDNFPNNHLIGVTILFISSNIRIFQAKKQGKDPYMEASRVWRSKKDMLGEYDFFGPTPDYSNKFYNILYFSLSLLSIGLIIFEVLTEFN